jgi:hypothetical protein
MTEKYKEQVRIQMERINKQINSGYLSKRKIEKMEPTELIENMHLIQKEIEKRGIGMLFGV